MITSPGHGLGRRGNPTLDVISAVIREYGVDPSWLLTGAYDSLSHRQALQTRTDEMPILVTRMLQTSPGQLS